ncbi:leucine-rich repeat protein [Plasmodium vinckei lentum]|uniref:Leucine-rich repeat protein n=1 Tax=Plasmodium vinckei lentum TaxID=138297 RepID=A0A6V7RSX6_PLAVN|nr:leucine-rich repeat protein [Plasmodium vinckei lentum]
MLLDLSRCKLKSLEDSDVILEKLIELNCDYTSITYLDVSYNNIKTLKGLRHFENLKILNISNNELTSLDGDYIPCSTEKIICDNNNLSDICFKGLTHEREESEFEYETDEETGSDNSRKDNYIDKTYNYKNENDIPSNYSNDLKNYNIHDKYNNSFFYDKIYYTNNNFPLSNLKYLDVSYNNIKRLATFEKYLHILNKRNKLNSSNETNTSKSIKSESAESDINDAHINNFISSKTEKDVMILFFNSLETLHLRGNKLTNLKGLSVLKNLKVLDLRSNLISHPVQLFYILDNKDWLKKYHDKKTKNNNTYCSYFSYIVKKYKNINLQNIFLLGNNKVFKPKRLLASVFNVLKNVNTKKELITDFSDSVSSNENIDILGNELCDADDEEDGDSYTTYTNSDVGSEPDVETEAETKENSNLIENDKYIPKNKYDNFANKSNEINTYSETKQIVYKPKDRIELNDSGFYDKNESDYFESNQGEKDEDRDASTPLSRKEIDVESNDTEEDAHEKVEIAMDSQDESENKKEDDISEEEVEPNKVENYEVDADLINNQNDSEVESEEEEMTRSEMDVDSIKNQSDSETESEEEEEEEDITKIEIDVNSTKNQNDSEVESEDEIAKSKVDVDSVKNQNISETESEEEEEITRSEIGIDPIKNQSDSEIESDEEIARSEVDIDSIKNQDDSEVDSEEEIAKSEVDVDSIKNQDDSEVESEEEDKEESEYEDDVNMDLESERREEKEEGEQMHKLQTELTDLEIEEIENIENDKLDIKENESEYKNSHEVTKEVEESDFEDETKSEKEAYASNKESEINSEIEVGDSDDEIEDEKEEDNFTNFINPNLIQNTNKNVETKSKDVVPFYNNLKKNMLKENHHNKNCEETESIESNEQIVRLRDVIKKKNRLHSYNCSEIKIDSNEKEIYKKNDISLKKKKNKYNKNNYYSVSSQINNKIIKNKNVNSNSNNFNESIDNMINNNIEENETSCSFSSIVKNKKIFKEIETNDKHLDDSNFVNHTSIENDILNSEFEQISQSPTLEQNDSGTNSIPQSNLHKNGIIDESDKVRTQMAKKEYADAHLDVIEGSINRKCVNHGYSKYFDSANENINDNDDNSPAKQNLNLSTVFEKGTNNVRPDVVEEEEEEGETESMCNESKEIVNKLKSNNAYKKNDEKLCKIKSLETSNLSHNKLLNDSCVSNYEESSDLSEMSEADKFNETNQHGEKNDINKNSASYQTCNNSNEIKQIGSKTNKGSINDNTKMLNCIDKINENSDNHKLNTNLELQLKETCLKLKKEKQYNNILFKENKKLENKIKSLKQNKKTFKKKIKILEKDCNEKNEITKKYENIMNKLNLVENSKMETPMDDIKMQNTYIENAIEQLYCTFFDTLGENHIITKRIEDLAFVYAKKEKKMESQLNNQMKNLELLKSNEELTQAKDEYFNELQKKEKVIIELTEKLEELTKSTNDMKNVLAKNENKLKTFQIELSQKDKLIKELEEKNNKLVENEKVIQTERENLLELLYGKDEKLVNAKEYKDEIKELQQKIKNYLHKNAHKVQDKIYEQVLDKLYDEQIKIQSLLVEKDQTIIQKNTKIENLQLQLHSWAEEASKWVSIADKHTKLITNHNTLKKNYEELKYKYIMDVKHLQTKKNEKVKELIRKFS